MNDSMKHAAAGNPEDPDGVDTGWFDDPAYCPRWCIGGHRDALEEGIPAEAAATHMSHALGGILYELSGWGRTMRPNSGSWQIQLTRQPNSDGRGFAGPPIVHLQAIELPLTAGEARSLAAQLVALADKADGS